MKNESTEDDDGSIGDGFADRRVHLLLSLLGDPTYPSIKSNSSAPCPPHTDIEAYKQVMRKKERAHSRPS
jgi:hypothetical protein